MIQGDFSTIVKNNLNTTDDVTDAIDEAIKFVSNFFYLRKIDDSKSVTTGDLTIAKPDRCHRVTRLKIGDNYIDEADKDKLQSIEDNSAQRWYVEDDVQGGDDENIHLTEAISADDNGATIKIHYLSGYEPFLGDDEMDTDLPERLHPLVTVFASYFYMGGVVSYVKDNKGSFPDMTIWDIVHIWETWRIQAFALLDSMKEQHYG